MKPWKCLHCGEKAGVPVLYGLPTRAAAEGAAAGELVLGGCVLTDDDPPRCCTSCRAALWPGGVFAAPGAAADLRLIVARHRRCHLEVSSAAGSSMGLAWRGGAVPEGPVRFDGEAVDAIAVALVAPLMVNGARRNRWLRSSGLNHVGEMEGPADRCVLSDDGMISFSGPGGGLLVHGSAERVLLQLVKHGYRHQGFRSIAEFTRWLDAICPDVDRVERD